MNIQEKIEQLKNKTRFTVDDLRDVVVILRSEQGCPWDREQDHHSIRNDMLEEAYEAVEAIDTDDPEQLREELGDVLFQTVFHACIAEEEARFVFDDVVGDVCRKMILRHPHVFGDVEANTTEKVLENWEQIKQASHHRTSVTEALEGVAKTLPALMRAGKLAKKAAKAGLYTAEAEELSEEELADALFALAAQAQMRGWSAEELLDKRCSAFIREMEAREKG